MISEQVVRLISKEQVRQQGQLISDVDLDVYLEKIFQKAEILSHYESGECKGMVAYYCNDKKSKIAFITLVLVDQEARGTGLGKILTHTALSIMKRRSFKLCRLEVKKTNAVALKVYRDLGFYVACEGDEKYTLEVNLESSS